MGTSIKNKYSFEKYEVLDALGSGAFSNVLLAKQISTGQKVAIKVLKVDPGNETDSTDARIIRFKREMKLCADLYHTNIVKVLDFGKTLEGDLFTVFEYVPGKTLGQIINDEGAISIQRSFKIMSQILAAVNSAHSNGIIHRDLKPDNIIISTDGSDTVKLLDFGISTFVNDDSDLVRVTLTQDFLGTPAYASPEQVRGEKITHKADIFAWGLIFIECLTGENAYNENNKARLLQKQLSKEPVPIPSSLRGSSLGDFLSWILQKDPQRRAADTSEVLKRFRIITPGSIPQSGGFLAANDKTFSDSLNVSRQDEQKLSRRSISTLICEMNLVDHNLLESAEFADCLFFESFELCRTIAENNGAFTASCSGGRLVFYFGYPSPGDFHDRSAAKTALDISTSLTQSQRALQVTYGVKLDWKLSVQSGEVTIKKSFDKDEVFGVFLGESAELCSSAPINEIVVSGALQNRLQKSFNFHKLPEENLYRLTGMREVQSLFNRYKNDQLHGRSTELQKLEAIRLKSLSEGQAVMIQGEAGIGKSRFMAESVTTTSIERSVIYELLCFPENSNSALAPFLDFLKKYFKITEFSSQDLCDDSISSELASNSFDSKEYISLMYYWMGVESKLYKPLELPPKRQKELFLELTCKLFFEHILEDRATLIFDDLHWADPTSLELLGMMLEQVNNYSCIILMSARPEFISPWNKKLISLIKLQGLDEGDVSSMIRSRLGQKDLPAKLIDAVIERVDGNPLFAEELIKNIVSDDNQILSERDVPGTLRELFSNRLDRVGDAKLTAQLASVLGRKFKYDLLKAIHPLSEGVLLADLTQLLAAGFIHVVPRSDTLEYVFHHALVCDNAYESMSRKMRVQTHRKAAEELQRAFESSVESSSANSDVSELAYHFYKCEDFKQAQEYNFAAGNQVLKLSAYQEAIEYFYRSLECLSKLEMKEPELEINIRIKLGVCLKTIYGWQDSRAIDEYDKIMTLSSQSSVDYIDELAPIIFGRWAAEMTKMKFRDALKLAAQYIELAEASGKSEALMQAHLTYANNLFWLGETPKAKEHVDKSLKYYEGLDSASLIEKVGYEPVTMVYMLDVWCTCSLGEVNRAESLLKEYLTFSESLNHPFSHAIILQTAAWHYFHTQEVEPCLEYSQKLIDVSEKYGLVFYEGVGRLFYGWAMAKSGKAEAGIKDMNRAYHELINPDGGRFLNSLYCSTLCNILLEDNESLPRAIETLEDALELALETDENCYLPEMYRLLAEAEMLRQNISGSIDLLKQSIKIAEKQGMRVYQLRSTLDLTTAKLMSDDESGVEDLASLITEFSRDEEFSELIEARELVEEFK